MCAEAGMTASHGLINGVHAPLKAKGEQSYNCPTTTAVLCLSLGLIMLHVATEKANQEAEAGSPGL